MKKTFLLISIILIYGCGYSPLYIAGKKDLFLNVKSIKGDYELNNYIKNNLRIASKENSLNVYDIDVETKFEKIVLTKDATGEATDYKLDLDVKFTIISENKSVFYKESFKIKKNNEKFEQSKYEREIKRNFSEIVKNKLILYVLNLDDN
jgi:outer membrane lipopolysaccharide assembly protein LptE/RlpB